ncbi:triacylglycerol lipase FGL4 [Stachybotrys elegans]|uniref:Carboxylic ester hydrolase n=1 Tax=Stachybotrys elegans TaxID=80388 RepID=A0A8K0SRM5_9HYPO|nr:triacylglycerol lipase FGL4 [Stachybotrys elegans]
MGIMSRSARLLQALLSTSQIAIAHTSYIYNPVALEGYGKFGGTVLNQSLSGRDLPQAVDAWLGIDYSTQPTGDGRFAPVTWPEPFEGIKLANEFGNSCVQDVLNIPAEFQDEACLNFNVFRTPGIPLDQKLPVLVWIHGGAFYTGSYRSFDGASFAAYSKEPIVVVNFHYRVNSLGFLPSALFHEEGLENLGIRDQRLFLEFVHKHIGAFGGDPDAVTIGGRSAGAHSVGIHVFHNYASDEGEEPLFAGAIHQSGSVTSRAFPNSTYPLYKTQFDRYVTFLGCDSIEDNAEALACLRSADIDQIRYISTEIYNEYNPYVTWPFQPVHNGPLFEKPGSEAGVDGDFFNVRVISSTVSDEGKLYLPGDLKTNEEFVGYIHNGSPGLTEEDLALLEELYPDPATDPESPYANSPNSTQYNRLSAAWSDYGYICPGQETAYRMATDGAPTWKLRFNTNNRSPAWQGIPHTSDTRYTWSDPGTEFPEISSIYHAYLASFVVAGDPNTHRFPGSPEWPMYEPTGYGLDSEPAKQLVVQPESSGGVKVEDDGIRREQCLYWRDVDRASRLNK